MRFDRLFARFLEQFAWLFGAWLFGTCLSSCTLSREPEDLRGQDVRLTMIHTSDVHSRLLPYQYAPNLPDRNLGLNVLSGMCIESKCSSDFSVSCSRDSDCAAFPTASVGGLARMATVIKRERARSPRSLHLDSGDMFQGAPVFNLFNGEVEVRTMGLLGVQGMALGNHEFDKGAVMLGLQLMNNGPNFPILAANYEWSDPDDQRSPKLGRFIQPVSVFNVKGLRVGVIGLGNVSSLNSSIEGDNSLGLRARDAKQAVSELVRVLRPQVDLMMVVSHMGPEDDVAVSREVSESSGDEETSDPNSAAVDLNGIDVVLGGHLHTVYYPPVDISHYDTSGVYQGHTIIVNSGAFAKFVGSLDMVVHVGDPDSADPLLRRSFVKSYTFKILPIGERPWQQGDPTDPCDPSIRCDPPHPSNAKVTCPSKGSTQPRPNVVCTPPDADMSRLLEPYEIKMKQLLNLGQVYAVVPCPAGSSVCPKILRNDAGGGDSQLGNLVATSMRLRPRVEADFALTNSLGIRADFESGPLTLEQLYNVFPFDNTITTQFLSGDEVLQMLDFVADRSSERGCKTQVQVSGIYFTLNCANQRCPCRNKPELCDCSQTADCQTYRAQCPTSLTCSERLKASAAQKAQWVGPFADQVVLGDGCRNVDGTVNPTNCKPLDCFASYKAAVNDYISVGGSGFVVLKRNTTRFNTGISLRDALADFIRTLGADAKYRCSDAGQYRNVKGRGPTGEYDYSSVTCLLPEVFAHDGRILPLVR
ncbi:MAG TPA: 5'-nucleotidase C-terminal domain-containing protein [Pseudomonadota bacterium]|nr:5'-nucleotidase C-terminal domain-containing protein [Pseudomonadota bacterium]